MNRSAIAAISVAIGITALGLSGCGAQRPKDSQIAPATSPAPTAAPADATLQTTPTSADPSPSPADVVNNPGTPTPLSSVTTSTTEPIQPATSTALLPPATSTKLVSRPATVIPDVPAAAPTKSATIQSAAVSGNPPIKSVTVLVSEHGGRVDWSAQNVIAFSKFTNGKSGGEIYTMKPDGSAQTCVTCGKPQLSHLSNDQPAWSPNGKYILFQSVDQALYNSLTLAGAQRDRVVQGGAGVDNNLWVVTPDGSSLTQLTHVQQSEAVLHPHFSYDGKKLYWAARVRNKGAAGAQWMLAIADFVDDGAGPHLANERTFQPVGQQVFYEAHNFLPDDQGALFSTDANPTAELHPTVCVCALNILQIAFSTGRSTALTSTTNVWNEHAQVAPDGKKIVWISSQGYPFTPDADWQSTLKTDLWMMNADGSGKQQLTFFNTPGNAQYTGARVILSDGSWNPTGDKYVMQSDSIANRGDSSQVIVFNFASPQ